MDLYEPKVTEVCPHCMSENTLVWSVEVDGYTVYCPHCGKKMMLCDECLHADDNKKQLCDWTEQGCFRTEDRDV